MNKFKYDSLKETKFMNLDMSRKDITKEGDSLGKLRSFITSSSYASLD
jgi:hypothetical protein